MIDFPILSSLILLPILGALFIFFSKSLHWETLKHSFGVTTEVMKVCIPENERSKCRWSARSHVLIWIVAIGCSIFFQTWLPVLFVVNRTGHSGCNAHQDINRTHLLLINE